MSRVDLVQALVDYFEIDISQYGEFVTEENLEKVLSDYDFVSGAYLGYGGQFLSLKGVVSALSGLCEDGWRC